MYLPIRRWRAVVVGMVLILAGHRLAALASAGVVPPPPASEPPPARDDAAAPGPQPMASSSLPLPQGKEDQPFWFPGVDGEADSALVSSVPVTSKDLGPGLPGVQEHPLIPLPGAAWTGMAGLLGLGAVRLLRNFHKLLA